MLRFLSLQSRDTSTSSFSLSQISSLVADWRKSCSVSKSDMRLLEVTRSSAYTFCSWLRYCVYSWSSSPWKLFLADTQCSTLIWNCSIVLCSLWWMLSSFWTLGKSDPYSASWSCFNLLRHHSVHSRSWRKWMLVSTSRVSRTVRVCRVTVLSSTGNDMEARGVMSFECSSDLSATQRWCSFWTRLWRSVAWG